MPEIRHGTERLAMLLACGSPGSAMAYHGLTPRFEADLLQCNQTEATGIAVAAAPLGAARRSGIAIWISELFRSFRESIRQREMRDREAYLAEAQNISDLEGRMRALERATLSRGGALG